MTATLARVATEHQDRLMRHVDALPALADELDRTPWADLSPRLADQHSFLVTTLIPHMEAVEAAVHPELDRLLSCGLGMAPLEREHVEIRRLIERLGGFTSRPASSEPSSGETLELGRILVKLYSILKVHLREESLYLPMLEHNVSPEQAEAIAVAMEHAARVEL